MGDMKFYSHFAERQRNPIGVKIKMRQARIISQMAFNTVSENCHILELGPGDGYIANIAAESGCQYLGIEASKEVAEKLIGQGHPIKRAFIPPLPEGIGKFDCCFMLHIIEHMKDMLLASKLIEDVSDHLLENGKLILTSPDYTRWKTDFYDCDYTHHLPFTIKRLRQLLSNLDFQVVHETIYVGPIFGYKGLPLYWIIKLLYCRTLDELFSRYIKNDIWYRGYLTFLPSILVIAKKKSP
jgi:2-polyprenyl-3-methyl-5-hydroxy-6-metoxy-1,4-benzoquinol methylase